MPVLRIENGRLNLQADYFFGFDSAELRNAGPLREFLPKLERTGSRFVITGRTDGLGTVQHNLDLSRRRAASVRSWLLDNGIPREQIVDVAGIGERGAVDGVANPRLRRVDIRLVK